MELLLSTFSETTLVNVCSDTTLAETAKAIVATSGFRLAIIFKVGGSEIVRSPYFGIPDALDDQLSVKLRAFLP